VPRHLRFHRQQLTAAVSPLRLLAASASQVCRVFSMWRRPCTARSKVERRGRTSMHSRQSHKPFSRQEHRCRPRRPLPASSSRPLGPARRRLLLWVSPRGLFCASPFSGLENTCTGRRTSTVGFGKHPDVIHWLVTSVFDRARVHKSRSRDHSRATSDGIRAGSSSRAPTHRSISAFGWLQAPRALPK
jgi:hypothetical protein